MVFSSRRWELAPQEYRGPLAAARHREKSPFSSRQNRDQRLKRFSSDRKMFTIET
jgi:hypothetical protein